MEERKHFEERTVTLKHTKRRLIQEEKESHEAKNGPVQTMTEPGVNCGQWYLKYVDMGSHYDVYTCRICYQGSPTLWPYEECIGPIEL